jgi:hypothetical protein
VVNWTTDDQRHLGPDQELSNCEENIWKPKENQAKEPSTY